MQKKIRDRRIARFHRRGISGLSKPLVLSEWKAAADVWNRHISPVSGWTVDMGAGNGGFWNYVEKPQKIALLDIAPRFKMFSAAGFRVIGNAVEPSFRVASVECIVALGLIEYLDNLVETLTIWREITGDNGRILFSNSPKIIPNALRRLFCFVVRPRSDEIVKEALRESGWRVCENIPVCAGWQSLFAARAA